MSFVEHLPYRKSFDAHRRLPSASAGGNQAKQPRWMFAVHEEVNLRGMLEGGRGFVAVHHDMLEGRRDLVAVHCDMLEGGRGLVAVHHDMLEDGRGFVAVHCDMLEGGEAL